MLFQKKKIWKKNDSLQIFDNKKIFENSESLIQMLEAFYEYGYVIIENTEAVENEVLNFAEKLVLFEQLIGENYLMLYQSLIQMI